MSLMTLLEFSINLFSVSSLAGILLLSISITSSIYTLILFLSRPLIFNSHFSLFPLTSPKSFPTHPRRWPRRGTDLLTRVDAPTMAFSPITNDGLIFRSPNRNATLCFHATIIPFLFYDFSWDTGYCGICRYRLVNKAH